MMGVLIGIVVAIIGCIRIRNLNKELDWAFEPLTNPMVNDHASNEEEHIDRAAAAAEAERQAAEKNSARERVKSSPVAQAAAERILASMVAIPGWHFKMSKTEVTQSQWESIMGKNPSHFKGADNPVENVSWNDCQDFLDLLNGVPIVKESGLVFRLPTIKEWRYACRAGATGEYCRLFDGTEITENTLGQVAWFEDNSDKKTHPVGQKEPNAFGLYDMNGNVLELTSTLGRLGRYDTERWMCGGGGCWLLSADQCKTSIFSGSSGKIDWQSDCLGFRVCVSDARAGAESILKSMIDIPGKNYKLSKTEITQAQWESIMDDTPSIGMDGNNPVNEISWDDCQEFLRRLNALSIVTESGLVFRLPTNDEWEFACRAGATGDYCRLADGTEITEANLDRVTWYKENSENKDHPVGQKEPNAFGLYDMLGNVSEWTASTIDGTARISGGRRSWSARYSKLFSRSGEPPSTKDSNWGVRLCADTKEELTRKEELLIRKIAADLVEIPGKHYKLGKFEVTQAQWKAVTGKNPSNFKGENNPVDAVSWDKCQAFLEKLNALPAAKASGLVFRLPTDDEWKFACRAGATGKYCRLADGTEITAETLGEVAWFDDNSNAKTHPVGQKKPNAFGLFDMHGNVMEMTSPVDGGHHYYRGGHWSCSASSCETSNGVWDWDWSSSYWHDNLGFRLCAEDTTK